MIAKITKQHTIILETLSDQTAETALKYSVEIITTLTTLQLITFDIIANSRMSRFIIHGIPSSIGANPIEAGNGVAAQVHANHP